MTPGRLQARLAQVERTIAKFPVADPDGDLKAVADLTATMAQFRRVYADEVTWLRTWLLGHAPALRSLRGAGLEVRGMSAVGYAPDEELESMTSIALFFNREHALVVADPALTNKTLNKYTRQTVDPRLVVKWVLVMGDDRAMPLRSMCWTPLPDGGWSLSPAAVAAQESVAVEDWIGLLAGSEAINQRFQVDQGPTLEVRALLIAAFRQISATSLSGLEIADLVQRVTPKAGHIRS